MRTIELSFFFLLPFQKELLNSNFLQSALRHDILSHH